MKRRKDDEKENLFVAAQRGRKDLIEEILARGTSNINEQFGNEGETALMGAVLTANQEMVEYLIGKQHADVDIRRNDGSTALTIAVMTSLKSIVDILLIRGRANPNISRNFDNFTPLHVVSFGPSSAIRDDIALSLLKSGADPNIPASDGKTPLHICSEKGSLSISSILLQPPSSQKKANVNAIDELGQTALIIAAEKGDVAFMDLLFKTTSTTKVNLGTKRYSDNSTALVISSCKGHANAVDMLIKNGDDPNDGNPLWYASKFGHVSVVSLLLRSGACVDSLLDGVSCLEIASECGHLKVVEELIRFNADVTSVSPLVSASLNGHSGVVDLLLQGGMSPNGCNNGVEDTALAAATRGNQLEIVEMLIRAGADLNKPGLNGIPPLIVAIKRGNIKLLQILIKSGANVNVITNEKPNKNEKSATNNNNNSNNNNNNDNNNATALAIAKERGNKEIVELLLKSGADSILPTGTIKTGWLRKTGKINKKLKSRWIVLTQNSIIYSKTPQSSNPQGQIPINSISECLKVNAEELNLVKELMHVSNAFKLITLKRVFFFVAETETDLKSWIDTISCILPSNKQSSLPSPSTTSQINK